MSNAVQLDAIFKRNYDTGSEVFASQQNLKAFFWNKIKVSPLKPTPQGIYMPVTMSGNENGGAQNEDESFEDPGTMNPQQPSIKSKLVTWPFQVTGTAIELSESNKQAFAAALHAQQKDNLNRMFSDLNRQSLGKGTGQLSLANGSGSGVTALIVDNPFPFRRGMKIDAFASLGGAKEIDGVQITAVNYTTSTLTLAVASTWSDNAIIVKKGKRDGVLSGAIGKELTGTQAICDTTVFSTTFQGLAVASNPEWQGNVVSAGTAPVSHDFLHRVLNRARIVGGGDPDTLISNYGQARVFLGSELTKTRYEPGSVKAGATVLKWMDLEWLIDKDYDFNEVGMYDSEYIQKFQTREPHLSKLTGLTLYQVGGFDKVGGYYSYYGDMGSWKRNANARGTDLTEPAI
jgi:hypothetical protein